MYSLVDGLVPESSGMELWFVDIFCSSYAVTNPFISFSPFSNSSTGDTVISSMIGWQNPICICQALEEALRSQLDQALLSMHFLVSKIVSALVTAYEIDPQVEQSLDGLCFRLCSNLCLCILLPVLNRTNTPTLWSSFFFSFMLFLNCILDIQRFWAKIPLSVSASEWIP